MPEPRRLASTDAGFDAALETLLAFELSQDPEVDSAVDSILEAVRARGDAALLEFTQRFDRWTPASAGDLAVPLEAARAALDRVPRAEREALESALDRIRRFHERQRQPSWQVDDGDGAVLGQQVVPLDRVGIYVPGGKASYPSSVLMNAVAAKVAGVPEHLDLAVDDPDTLLHRIRHAGAIFLGHHASEALGDYCAGPNHVLPTARTARFSSPLGVYDFQKRSSVIGVSPRAAARLGPTAATLARAEGLEAHARSAEMRGEGEPR